MGLFDRFSISRAITTAVSSPAPSAERAAALSRLRAMGAGAVPKLVEALPKDQFNVIGPLLADLVTNATLPALVTGGLLSEEAEVASRAKRVLMAAKLVDPNRAFDLYVGKGGSVVNIADYLTQRKEAIGAKTMLRLLEFAREDNQPAVFTLIDRIASPAMNSALIGFLKNAAWEAKCHIARTIARFPTDAVRDALVRLLSDPNKSVRQAALEGVAALGMPVPVAPLCALLRDSDMQVQAKAIEALVKVNDPNSVRHLIEVLQDESEHVRRAAVEVLNAVGNANAIKDLLSALKDRDWWVRVRAADALGSIGGPKVIDAVLQFLADDDEFMRRTAVEILNTTKDPRAFQHLVQALQDGDWWVRERAIDALANLGNKDAVPHLVELLSQDDQATPVAIRALAQIGDPRAVAPVLDKLASADEMIQREAIEALSALTTPPQLNTVLQRLGEFTPLNDDIRETARRISSEIAAKNSRNAPRQSAQSIAWRAPAKIKSRDTMATAPAPDAHDDVTMACTMEISPGEIGASKPNASPATVRPSTTAQGGSPDAVTLAPGRILADRYRVIRELGKGGFGTVMQVEDRMVGEEIAIKVINPNLVRDDITINRFMHEVRYARKITHENVIRVHDFMMLDGYYAISMEYFASVPLARRIRSWLQQDLERGIKFARDISRGIHVAHQANIMHRDLKPANLLVNDDDVLKIVDFGLAAASSNTDSRVTKTGHLVGTPTYMSPEQARGLNVDNRTDIYSLGVVMYEMFTGSVPYVGDNPMAVLFQHLEGNKASPRSRNPAISPQLESIILKAMAVEPDHRFQNAQELLAAFEALELEVAA